MTIAVPKGEIIKKKSGKLNYNDNLDNLVSRGAEKMYYKISNVKKKQVAPWIRVETVHSFFPSQSLRQKHMVTSQSRLTTGGR